MKDKVTAILLAAGRGLRMGSKIQKQYLKADGHPIITYPLAAFEESKADEVILVVGEGEMEYARTEIVGRYGYRKVKKIIAGGAERYDSVYRGLCAVEDAGENSCVLIHDGARAFLTAEQANLCIREVRRTGACVMAVPVKDTIKVVDEEGYSVSTPDRRTIWQMQTPQCFILGEIREAYQRMMDAGDKRMTDDAMVMEIYGKRRVKMVRGSYDNIKITTPEDLIQGEAILKARQALREEKNG